MKIRFYILISLLLCLGIGARADNVVTISSVEGTPEEEVTVSIGLNNTDAVSSIQVSIPLDENLSLVDGSGTMSNRCQNHSLVVGVKDGVLNVFVYSISMAAIEGNSGEVASLRLKLGSQPATIPLTPSKIVLTDVRGTAIDGSAQSGDVTIRCAKAQYSTMEVDFGEVPIRSTYTQNVTVTNVGNADLVISRMLFSDINVFSTTTTLPLTIPAGDSQDLNITYAPVERGSINRTLKVECNSVSKLNTIKLKAQPFAVNELHIQDASGISDEEVTITMTMNNMDAISGYQVEFTLPSQLEYVDGSFALSDRKQDHTSIATLNGNVLLIMVYSGSDSPLTGEDGVIGTFRVKLVGRYGTMLNPTKTVLSATINNMVENVVSAVYEGYVDIQSPTINTDEVLDFGAVSVTEACEQLFNIYNSGSAPLTISRIVFDNENLCVKEALPLVITSWQSQNITVVYSSVEETPFEATMHIYSNDPDLRLRDVVVRGSRFAPNYLSISTPDIDPCDDLAIEIEADTYDPIVALQFDVTYPLDYYELSDNQAILEERAEGMTVAARQINENTLRYFCYFISSRNIAPGDGKLMTLLLKPKSESIPPDIYNVSMTNIKLGTQEMADKYAGSDISASFKVNYLPGDANGDGKVTIVDAVFVVDYILGNASDRFIFGAANVDGDSEITISDAIGIVNIILGN